MKKLLIVTNVLTVCILLIIVIGGKSCKVVQRIVCNHTCDSTNGGTRSGECTTCYPDACTQQFGGVNAFLAKNMLGNYRDNQLESINFSDSRSVWFSLPTIKRFIHEIESKVCDTCSNQGSNQLGVRIYYAAYPSTANWTTFATALNGVDPNYASQHTVLMVPTIEQGNVHVDFDPNYLGANCTPLPMCDVYEIVSKINDPQAQTVTVLTSGNNSMQNHGTMDPPGGSFMSVADEVCE